MMLDDGWEINRAHDVKHDYHDNIVDAEKYMWDKISSCYLMMICKVSAQKMMK